VQFSRFTAYAAPTFFEKTLVAGPAAFPVGSAGIEAADYEVDFIVEGAARDFFGHVGTLCLAGGAGYMDGRVTIYWHV
jgi:hypothetical protein